MIDRDRNYRSLTEDEVATNIARLQAFRDDWDGEGSLAPTREALAASQRILKSAASPGGNVHVAPNKEGGVSVEFRAGSVHVHADIDEKGRVEVFVSTDGEGSVFFDVEAA